MKETASYGINRKPHAFKRFLKYKRAKQLAESEVFSYRNIGVTSYKVRIGGNGNHNNGAVEILDNKLIPSREAGECITDATWEDIEKRRVQERIRAENYTKAGQRITPEMARFAARKGLFVNPFLIGKSE